MPLYYEGKDEQRIHDIVNKARFGNSTEFTLASTQANRITKLDKAIRRASAGIAILGADHRVTRIFIERARFLGYTGNFSGRVNDDRVRPVQVRARRSAETEKKEEKAPKVKLVDKIELGGTNILDQLERFTSN